MTLTTILHLFAILAAWTIMLLILVGIWYTMIDVSQHRRQRRRWRRSRMTHTRRWRTGR